MNSENMCTVQVKNNSKTHFHLLCLAALSEEIVIRTTNLQILFTIFNPLDNFKTHLEFQHPPSPHLHPS